MGSGRNSRVKKEVRQMSTSIDLWYDKADCSHGQLKTRGKYRKGYPEGAVVHFTAGRSRDEQDAVQMTKMAEQRGHCYFVIGPTGKVYQSFPLSEWGFHAGPSEFGGLNGISQYLVGIEVCSAGKLSEAKDGLISWYSERVPREVSRFVDAKDSAGAGWYHKFTDAQEASLIELILWLKGNATDIFSLDYVVGHSEVASPRGRKSDPGGSLSVSMPELRSKLKNIFQNLELQQQIQSSLV